MRDFIRRKFLFISLLGLAFAGAACAAPQVEHVVDYQIIGDRSVKYIVVPAEKSQAGSMYFDSNVSLEICDIEPLPSQASDSEEEPPKGGVEKKCRQSRVLRTQEYR